MQTIVVLNAKGGSGKTTLATNLAGYYASRGATVVLKDCDPQESSAHWLAMRSLRYAPITGISTTKISPNMTRSWQHRLPPNTEFQIIDTPGGIDLSKNIDILRAADKILIPVAPSPVDIRASAMFVGRLQNFLHTQRVRPEIRIVISRVMRETPSLHSLKRIFTNLDLPIIASLAESEHYHRVAERGISIFEMSGDFSEKVQLDWQPLIQWLNQEGEHPLVPISQHTHPANNRSANEPSVSYTRRSDAVATIYALQENATAPSSASLALIAGSRDVKLSLSNPSLVSNQRVDTNATNMRQKPGLVRTLTSGGRLGAAIKAWVSKKHQPA